jgi:nitroreductase
MEAIRARRSIRSYKPEQPGKELLDEVLEAARLAPSARNMQDWKFIAVKNPGTIKALADSCGQTFLASAPVIIAGVALDTERVMRCEVPSHPVDVAIALSFINLAATARGLGCCWIGGFDQSAARKILGVPDKYKIVQMLTLGFPAEAPQPRPRKAAAEVVSFDKF